MKRISLLFPLIFVFISLMMNCSEKPTITSQTADNQTAIDLFCMPQTVCDDPIVHSVDGQNAGYKVMVIQTANDQEMLYVHLRGANSWRMTKTYVHIGDCNTPPIDENGQPILSEFQYSHQHLLSSNSENPDDEFYLYSIPLKDLPNNFCITVYGEMYKIDESTNNSTGETDVALTTYEYTLMDCGASPYASIGNFVWNDLNQNGIQDNGEVGVPDVTVNLMDCSGNVIKTTSTDNSGFYLFDSLEAGDYKIEFVLPDGYNFSPQDAGTDDALDSDADPNTGITTCTTLSIGEEDLSWDAGIYRPATEKASIGDYVWEDLNANGIQDEGEPGFGGITVTLLDCNGNQIATTATDGNGKYLFENLEPGDYKLQFTLPEGYAFSPKDATDDNIDSDVDPQTAMTTCTTLDAGETDLTWDAGLYDVTANCGECKGKVTQLTLRYDGDIENAHIVVEQKKEGTVFDGIVQPGGQFTFSGKDKKGTLGTEIKIYVNDFENTKIHTSCSQPIGPGLVRGDFTVISGFSKDGGALCPVEETGESCGECDGKITRLTLRYDGTINDAHIQVEQKKEGYIFDGTVQPGEEFTFDGKDKKGTMGTEIKIFVNGIENTKIHTSCSQPIGIGMVSGDFTITDGYSRNGGKLCDYQN